MFVTQKEIAARLASDENLLNSLCIDHSPKNDVDAENESVQESDEDTEQESLQEPDDETASANELSSRGSDEDIKLQRILDEALHNKAIGSERNQSGRPKDAPNRSNEQRADIALMGAVLGHNLASDLLGVSTASTSLHGRGVISHGQDVDFDLDRKVKHKLHKIRNKSANALIKVLDSASDADMYAAIKNAKDAVFVANQLASVIQKVQPQEREEKPTAQFVIIQPTVRSIEHYETINV